MSVEQVAQLVTKLGLVRLHSSNMLSEPLQQGVAIYFGVMQGPPTAGQLPHD